MISLVNILFSKKWEIFWHLSEYPESNSYSDIIIMGESHFFDFWILYLLSNNFRVSADISSGYMLCCCILNPENILRDYQFHACELNHINHYVANIRYVILCITRTSWHTQSSTGSKYASLTLLTTTILSNLLWYGYEVVIIATSWTLVKKSTKIQLSRTCHGVWCKIQETRLSMQILMQIPVGYWWKHRYRY